MRRICSLSQTGTSLVEVLAALLILVSFVLPITKFRAYLLKGGPSDKELAQTLAVSALEDLGNRFYRTAIWPASGSDDIGAGGHLFHRSWLVEDVGTEMGTGRQFLRRATVIVTCSGCSSENLRVEVVDIIAKIPHL